MPRSHKTLARSAAEMDSLQPLWNDLLAKAPHTLFQRFQWNRLAAQIFHERFEPAVCAVESDAGAAIIPAALNLATNQLELLGESLFDYRDVLHAGDSEVLQVAWQTLAEMGLPLSVIAVRAETVEARWQQFAAGEFAKAPQVDAAAVDEVQFRSAHSRVGRHLRRMQKRGVELHLYYGNEHKLVRRLYELKCDQFAGDPNNIFRDARRREFMVAISAAERDGCQIFTLEDSANCIVAGLLTFLDGELRRFYTIYFDPAWTQYSPGVALVYEATARSLAAGLSCDYMTGEYPYKLRFANSTRALYRIAASAAELAKIANGSLRMRAA